MELKFDGTNYYVIAEYICCLLRDHAAFFIQADKASELDRFSTHIIQWAEKTYTRFYLLNTGQDALNDDEKLRISFYALGNMVYVNKVLTNPEEFLDPDHIHHFVEIILKEVPPIYYQIQKPTT